MTRARFSNLRYLFCMHDLGRLFADLWRDYTAINPQAQAIHRLLHDRGDVVLNDHIALRTFAGPAGLEHLARPFLTAGYRHGGSYRFIRKRLRAHHYDPPQPQLPKVFISELLVDELTNDARTTIADLVAQIPHNAITSPTFCNCGRPWAPVAQSTYEALRRESEYAAWMAAFGYRANHFTVSANALRSVASLAELCSILEAAGFVLNHSGGVIKGTADIGLEQASTLAAPTSVPFADGPLSIPGCYYEFALRHPVGGELFSGFVSDSADRLFESTDRR